jgi:hypothetical protein
VREALGRSRGGYGTKACVIADGRGRAIAFALAPGQAHELPLAPGLLGCLPDVPGWIVGDRGFASDAFRERIWNLGASMDRPWSTRKNTASSANHGRVQPSIRPCVAARWPQALMIFAAPFPITVADIASDAPNGLDGAR